MSPKGVMKLRKATMQDARTLFEWRNDPVTCSNSSSIEPVSLRQHRTWLKESLISSTRLLFIAEDANGSSVGTCRADLEREESGNLYYLLSWTVAPSYRANGYGKKMVQELLSQKELHGKVLKADVKKENLPSIRIGASCGFVESSSPNSELIRFVLHNL